MIPIVLISCPFHSHGNNNSLNAAHCTSPPATFLEICRSLFIYAYKEKKLAVPPGPFFPIRNPNLRIFKVNGNAAVHYLSAALSRAPLSPPLSSRALFPPRFSFFWEKKKKRENAKRLPVMMCIPPPLGWCAGLCVKSSGGVITVSYGCTCNWLAGGGNEFPPRQQIEL